MNEWNEAGSGSCVTQNERERERRVYWRPLKQIHPHHRSTGLGEKGLTSRITVLYYWQGQGREGNLTQAGGFETLLSRASSEFPGEFLLWYSIRGSVVGRLSLGYPSHLVLSPEL